MTDTRLINASRLPLSSLSRVSEFQQAKRYAQQELEHAELEPMELYFSLGVYATPRLPSAVVLRDAPAPPPLLAFVPPPLFCGLNQITN